MRCAYLASYNPTERSGRGRKQGPRFTSSISQFKTFFSTSVRLSPVAKGISIPGWRLISPAKAGLGHIR